METIRNIIQEYHTINKSRKTTHWHTNVYESIQHYLTIIDYVEKQVEPLEKALTTYIESKPNIVKEWIQYGLIHMTRYMNMTMTYHLCNRPCHHHRRHHKYLLYDLCIYHACERKNKVL